MTTTGIAYKPLTLAVLAMIGVLVALVIMVQPNSTAVASEHLELIGTTSPVAGEIFTLDVIRSTPDTPVAFVRGDAADGHTNVPRCPDLTIGLDNVKLFRVVIADVDGNASMSQLIPVAASGATVSFVAVDPTSCRVSNRVTVTFESPDP